MVGENSVNAMSSRTADVIVGILEVIATEGTAVQTLFARRIQTEFFTSCATLRIDIVLELVNFYAGARLSNPLAAKLAIKVASLCVGIPNGLEPDEELVNSGIDLICGMLNDISVDAEESVLTDALDAAKELLCMNEACQSILKKLNIIELFQKVLNLGVPGASDAALELLQTYLDVTADMGLQTDSADIFKILYP